MISCLMNVLPEALMTQPCQLGLYSGTGDTYSLERLFNAHLLSVDETAHRDLNSQIDIVRPDVLA